MPSDLELQDALLRAEKAEDKAADLSRDYLRYRGRAERYEREIAYLRGEIKELEAQLHSDERTEDGD